MAAPMEGIQTGGEGGGLAGDGQHKHEDERKSPLPSQTAAPPSITALSSRGSTGANAKSQPAVVGAQEHLPKSEAGDPPLPPPSINRSRKPSGPPSLTALCKIGGMEVPAPRSQTIDQHTRDEIKYMYIHEYAEGLNKLLETQWYTNNGLDRLFANFQLQQQFAGTLELFTRTKSTNFDEFLRLPPTERKLVMELMLLPMKVPNPNPADTELQTVIARLHVLECLLTGRVIQASPIIEGLPRPGMDPRQNHFWKHLGETITQASLCNPQYGVPTWPNAFENATQALAQLRPVLDGMENRDVLYSMAVLRHLGPRHLQAISRGEGVIDDGRERARVAVAKKFLEDQASGWGTTQVVQRVCGMVMTGLNHWGLV